jgi:hypothetical protein
MRFDRLMLILALLVGSAHAQEYDILKKFPPGMIRQIFSTQLPDSRGYQGVQRQFDRIHDVEAQRGGPELIAYGALTDNPQFVDAGFRVVDATFQEQHADGSIGDNKGYTETADTLYLEDLLRYLQILGESPLAGKYRDRVNSERGHIQQLVQYLSRPQQQQNLVQQNKLAPNRSFTVAVTFARANKFLGKNVWSGVSQSFYDLAMKQYRPSDGVFIESAGGDSSYQAVNLLDLEYLYIDFDRADVLTPFDKGLAWETRKIVSNGEISVDGNTRTGSGQEKAFGKAKGVNYNEVTEMFEIACLAMRHPEACPVAEHIHQYRVAHP